MKKNTPAIPPDDYSGSQADWLRELIERKHWNGKTPSWYGDIKLTSDEWWNILETCEGTLEEDEN